MLGRIKSFLTQARRVLMVASKPEKDEFRLSVKITAIGIVIIGFIGFIIFFIAQLLGGL